MSWLRGISTGHRRNVDYFYYYTWRSSQQTVSSLRRDISATGLRGVNGHTRPRQGYYQVYCPCQRLPVGTYVWSVELGVMLASIIQQDEDGSLHIHLFVHVVPRPVSHDLVPFLHRLGLRQRLLLPSLEESYGRLVVLTRHPALFPNAAHGL